MTAGDDGAEDVPLDLADRYAKTVERERGVFCHELNGLFGWPLADLGLGASLSFDDEKSSNSDTIYLYYQYTE